ncbi:hypothetical protein D9613_008741 [Agrocybe pediades]|uniref:Uncharacterized protein n=1 Tax=Agrocybe pediades TaxID=84607 RepID=A0A8H4QU44_9AGAR|nr:hypothetical protein D9613_008741 [Agrocybe pediades]
MEMGSQFVHGMISSFSPRDTDTVDMCPRPNVSKAKKTLRRIEIMLWAIITPELITLWAMQQWYGAKVMENEFASSGVPETERRLQVDEKTWVLLQMGGFVLYEKDKRKRILEWKALMEYYENGRVDLSEITEATIDDRSKADGFAKCIAFIQTSWFIVQCIARFSDERLALTELELVTAALAVLSLLMYCFWWNKPFNTEVPIVIILLDPIHEITSHQDLSIEDLSIQPDGNDDLPIHTKAVSKFRASIPAGIEFVRSSLLTLDPFKKVALIPYNFIKYVLGCIEEFVNPRPVDFYSMKVPGFYYYQGVSSVDGRIYPAYLANRPRSFLVAALFGAIHCAGWSDKMIFHTRAVSLLWRISSVIITGCPLLWISFVIFAHVEHAVQDSKVLAKANGVLMGVTYFLSLFSILLYIIARIILLIVAFVKLRYVPQAALNNIPWANVLPFIH